MKRYCAVAPDKGLSQFLQLKKMLGYEATTKLWNSTISHPQFLKDYSDTLVLDDEGIPTFDSLMANPYIQEKIGLEEIKKGIESTFPSREDTRENFKIAVGEALRFNTSNENNTKFVALVESEKGSIKVHLKPKSEANLNAFKEQFGVITLNNQISEILKTAGITEGTIKAAGINGITDFSKAKSLAESIIAVSDDMAGENALSEEFAHLCIEVFRDSPLIMRTKLSISNEDSLREILGDEYNAYYDKYEGDLDLMVEEALGKLLQKSFFNVSKAPKRAQSLFSRLVALIKNLFRPLNTDNLRQAVIDSQTAMDSLATKILSGELQVTKEKVQSIERNETLYQIASQLEEAKKIMDAATDDLTKMAKIQKNDTNIENIKELIRLKDLDTARSICGYLTQALLTLNSIQVEFNSKITSPDVKTRFLFLRTTYNYIAMYGKTLNALSTLLAESRENDPLELLSKEFEINGVSTVTIRTLLDRVKTASDNLASDFLVASEKTFVEFIKPFYDVSPQTPNPFAKKGENPRNLTVEDLIREADRDISWMDAWFSSMAESSDVMLQLFDQVAKRAKDAARMETINDSKAIQSAFLKAKKAGVTDFSFMYAKDDEGKRTKFYISFAEAEKTLNPAQLEFYHSFMTIKDKLDNKLTDKRAGLLHVIQIRKEHTFGGAGLIMQGKFNEAGEYYLNKLFDRESDDSLGMHNSRAALTDFEGKEHMVVPQYYLTDIEDQENVSDDPVGSLIAYAFMANNFHQMDEVVDALETGRFLMRKRHINERRGNKYVRQTFEYFGINVDSPVEVEWSKSNMATKLDKFFNSQIYGRYLQDQGVFTVFGKEVNKQKLTSVLLGASSHIQLGFNWLANTANIANGIAMANIEAAAGRFFKAKSLLQADKIYTSLLQDYLAELPSDIKTNKLALIDQYFDVRQNFDGESKRKYDKGLLEKIFGPNTAFIGQEMGDHWLYNRTAIAMLLETEALDDKGNKSNLYEALEVRKDANGVAYLTIKQGWTIPSLSKELYPFAIMGRRIANVNQKLFGIYNQDDAVAAQQMCLGRLALQYRKWMVPAFNKRFQAAQFNSTLDIWEEGYYRTTWHFIEELGKELKRGRFQLAAQWNSLSEEQRQNITRAITEVSQYLALLSTLLVIGIAWPDKKKRPWLVKFLHYQLIRQQTELGVLIPQPMMLHEGFKILNSPAAGMSVIDNMLSIIDAIADPWDWTEERKSGPYKGMSDLEKAIYINTPYLRSIKKATVDIEHAADYFNK